MEDNLTAAQKRIDDLEEELASVRRWVKKLEARIDRIDTEGTTIFGDFSDRVSRALGDGFSDL